MYFSFPYPTYRLFSVQYSYLDYKNTGYFRHFYNPNYGLYNLVYGLHKLIYYVCIINL